MAGQEVVSMPCFKLVNHDKNTMVVINYQDQLHPDPLNIQRII
ncbi:MULTISPECIES: hypothetical protein [Halomonadaceae]|nr:MULTISPECIES: hypothetical protein [Halomonas]|tara:strand:+ start:1093 stop:1221 length:129 start_codon:yes stop_codon:yes gene_type:complete